MANAPQPTEMFKDPNATLDYGFTWATWLGTDTILTSTWTITPATAGDTTLTTATPTHDTTTTTVWVTGGTLSRTYLLTNHIITAAGRQEDRSYKLIVRER